MGERITDIGSRASWVAVAAALTVLAGASTASARTEQLRWYHSDPDRVVRFEVRYGSSPGSYTSVENAGKPIPDEHGVFTYDLQVPDEATVFMAVLAFDGNGLQSPASNEQERVASSSGGDPDPDPAPAVLSPPGKPTIVP